MFSAMPAFSRCHCPSRSAPSLDGDHIRLDKFSERLNFGRLQVSIWGVVAGPPCTPHTSALASELFWSQGLSVGSDATGTRTLRAGWLVRRWLQAKPLALARLHVTGTGALNGAVICRFPSLRRRAGSWRGS
jgi:hypothetical protein